MSHNETDLKSSISLDTLKQVSSLYGKAVHCMLSGRPALPSIICKIYKVKHHPSINDHVELNDLSIV